MPYSSNTSLEHPGLSYKEQKWMFLTFKNRALCILMRKLYKSYQVKCNRKQRIAIDLIKINLF